MVQLEHLQVPFNASPAASENTTAEDPFGVDDFKSPIYVTGSTINLEPSKPLTLIAFPPPQSPPVQPPYLQPLLVSSPRPLESISISPPLLLPPSPLPSKPPDREVSTSPDLANSDSLTPLPPFLPPRLKPQPEPPDAVPSPSSTLCASPEPPEPPDLAKTLSRCDSKLPTLAMSVNDEVFTEKSQRGGSAATDSSSQVTEEHKVFASAIFTVLDSLSLIFVSSDSVRSGFAYDRDPHLASFHGSDSFFFIPQLLPSESQTHITMSTSFSTPIPTCVFFVVNRLFGDRATHVAIIVTSYNGTFTQMNSSNTVGKDSVVYHISWKGWINFTNCLEVFNHIYGVCYYSTEDIWEILIVCDMLFSSFLLSTGGSPNINSAALLLSLEVLRSEYASYDSLMRYLMGIVSLHFVCELTTWKLYLIDLVVTWNLIFPSQCHKYAYHSRALCTTLCFLWMRFNIFLHATVGSSTPYVTTPLLFKLILVVSHVGRVHGFQGWQLETIGFMIPLLLGAWPQQLGYTTFHFLGIRLEENVVELDDVCNNYLCVKTLWLEVFSTLSCDYEGYETMYLKPFPSIYLSTNSCSKVYPPFCTIFNHMLVAVFSTVGIMFTHAKKEQYDVLTALMGSPIVLDNWCFELNFEGHIGVVNVAST